MVLTVADVSAISRFTQKFALQVLITRCAHLCLEVEPVVDISVVCSDNARFARTMAEVALPFKDVIARHPQLIMVHFSFASKLSVVAVAIANSFSVLSARFGHWVTD